MTSCNTMWSVAQNNQIISMKMCVETVLAIVPLVNITNLTIPSLQNATLNSTKNVSFISNILNHTNITQHVPIVNRTNTSNTNNTVNIVTYSPSSFPEPNITIETTDNIFPSPSSSEESQYIRSPSSSLSREEQYIPSPSPSLSKEEQYSPSSSSSLSREGQYSPSPSGIKTTYIRGTNKTSPSMFNSTNLYNNTFHNSTLPNIIANDNLTAVAITIIVVSILLSLGLTWCLYKRKTKNNKIHDCTALTSHYKQKKKPNPIETSKETAPTPSAPKLIDTSKPSMNRPRDYLLETISNVSTPKTDPNPPKEEPQDPDNDDKTTSE